MDHIDDRQDDDAIRALGYIPSFQRDFSALSTIGFALGGIGVSASIAISFNTPMLLGGPASVTWCWLLGGVSSIALASCIAEIVSAYPTCGGLYGASAFLCPKKYRARVGWIVGWLNLLGLISGLTSVESGLASMILSAVSLSTHGAYTITPAKVVGVTIGLLFIHGMLNSLRTRHLALFASSAVFINIAAVLLIIILPLAMTPRSEMHAASYVFGADGLINGTGGWNDGLSFLLGMLSVLWTLTGFDTTGHICEELRHASWIAPTAIMTAVTTSVIFGWLINVVLVLCSGPFADLPGPTGSAFLAILLLRLGNRLSLFIWVVICLNTFYIGVQSTQATSRALYAFSRDGGIPDGRFFGHVTDATKTPLRAIWLTVFVAVLPALLFLASPAAANAIFAMAAVSLDLSYVLPILFRRLFHSHPEVNFKPGPFTLGNGWLGTFVNIWTILWILFISVIFSLPTLLPVTALNMNYAAPVTIGVVVITGLWYVLSAHRHYHGPPTHGIGKEKDADESDTDHGSSAAECTISSLP
ncbi:APC amino acid permease [Chiua virens]|nr:APC amino acid permease [Chiua virens]